MKKLTLLSACNLSLSFTERVIFSNVSFDVYNKNKIGFIGVNGAGKSTLFKVITGELQPDEGSVFVGRDTVLGYMEQHACAASEKTMLQELLTVFDDVIAAEKELDEISDKLSTLR